MIETSLLGMTDLETIYMIGIFVGTLILALAPYIRKIDEGKVTEWNHAYTFVMLVAFTVAFIASFIVFSLNPLEAATPPLALAQGLIVGLAAKPTVEELLKRLVPSWFKDVNGE